MANTDTPRGLQPVRDFAGAPYNGAANKYYIPSTDATAVYVGDAVKLAGSADADGVPTVAQAAAGDTLIGVVVGVVADTQESTVYRAASTARYVLVADDPGLIFRVQEDSVASTLAATDVGNNADLVVAAGSTLTGQSGMELDSSSKATTTAQCRIVGLDNTPDNEIGTNANWLVRIVEHRNVTATGV